MVLFLKILTVITIGWAIGFSNAMLTRWLDSALDYGKVFGIVRFKIVRGHAEKVNLKENFDELAKTAMLSPSFSDRLNNMNEVYWQIAKFAPGVQKFICKPCMSVWVFIPVAFVAGIGLLANDLHANMIYIYILAFAFNEYYIQK
jgi:hypothetical protein